MAREKEKAETAVEQAQEEIDDKSSPYSMGWADAENNVEFKEELNSVGNDSNYRAYRQGWNDSKRYQYLKTAVKKERAQAQEPATNGSERVIDYDVYTYLKTKSLAFRNGWAHATNFYDGRTGWGWIEEEGVNSCSIPKDRDDYYQGLHEGREWLASKATPSKNASDQSSLKENDPTLESEIKKYLSEKSTAFRNGWNDSATRTYRTYGSPDQPEYGEYLDGFRANEMYKYKKSMGTKVKAERPVPHEDVMVVQPAHYTFGEYEVIDVLNDWQLKYPLDNVVKYVARAGKKGDDAQEVQDLEKSRYYVNYRIRILGGTDWEPKSNTTEAVDELVEALLSTIQQMGTAVLPPIDGYKWFDVLTKYAPESAEKLRQAPLTYGVGKTVPIITLN